MTQHTKTKAKFTTTLLVVPLLAGFLAVAGSALADCDNDGVQVVVGSYNCQVQYCDQNSGAAAGAGAGGVGGGEAGAGAEAGTGCDQSNGSGSTGGAADRAALLHSDSGLPTDDVTPYFEGL